MDPKRGLLRFGSNRPGLNWLLGDETTCHTFLHGLAVRAAQQGKKVIYICCGDKVDDILGVTVTTLQDSILLESLLSGCVSHDLILIAEANKLDIAKPDLMKLLLSNIPPGQTRWHSHTRRTK